VPQPRWDSPIFAIGNPGYRNLHPLSVPVWLWVLRMPYWFVIVAFGFLPSIWIISISRNLLRTKRLPGHCLVCGYDLRATPDRCPECGTTPLKK
jgi:hypothetical protein